MAEEEIKLDQEFEDMVNELKSTWDIDNLLSFSEIDIQDKLAENSNKLMHFTELYQRELNDYHKIIELKERVIGEQYIHYKTKEMGALKQGEIEKYYLPKDPKVMRLNEIARKQKWRCDFFQGVCRALDKMQWNMQAFLKSVSKGL